VDALAGAPTSARRAHRRGTDGKALGHASVEHQGALVRTEAVKRTLDEAQVAVAKSTERTRKLDERIEQAAARRAKLEPQRTIRQLDVAQDSVLTAAKLTALQLISFAIREYLSSMPMTPHTFISRVFGLRGRKEIRGDEEHVIIVENPRDPDVNAAVAAACERLNRRRLERDGRRLTYSIEEAR
jgi:hypothetical protein